MHSAKYLADTSQSLAVQVAKKGTPIEVKALAFFTLGIGLVETIAITTALLGSPVVWDIHLLDEFGMYLGGINNGIPAGDGRIVEYYWILAEGMITTVIGFFLLKGYKVAWIANITLSVFRLAMFHPFNMLFPVALNALVIFFMFRPRVRRFYFDKPAINRS